MSVNLVNKRFGRLVVIRQAGKNNWNQRLWLCHCDCGKQKVVVEYSIKSGDTKSCNCLQRETVINRNTTHNHAGRKKKSVIYTTWTSMIQRCGNQNCIDYSLYGGRGITVCQRWTKFTNFLIDMPGWRSGLQIDRIDNSKGYSKSNCRWSTPKQQGRNKRNNRMISHNGKSQCLSAWAEEYDINYKLLWKRICVHNWSIGKALITPTKRRRMCL